eukprot:3094435-Rhodomonas_salina.2
MAGWTRTPRTSQTSAASQHRVLVLVFEHHLRRLAKTTHRAPACPCIPPQAWPREKLGKDDSQWHQRRFRCAVVTQGLRIHDSQAQSPTLSEFGVGCLRVDGASVVAGELVDERGARCFHRYSPAVRAPDQILHHPASIRIIHISTRMRIRIHISINPASASASRSARMSFVSRGPRRKESRSRSRSTHTRQSSHTSPSSRISQALSLDKHTRTSSGLCWPRGRGRAARRGALRLTFHAPAHVSPHATEPTVHEPQVTVHEPRQQAGASASGHHPAQITRQATSCAFLGSIPSLHTNLRCDACLVSKADPRSGVSRAVLIAPGTTCRYQKQGQSR